MKAIIIKFADKPVIVEQINDLTTKQFIELQKEAEQVKQDINKSFNDNVLKRISDLENEVALLKKQVQDLYHQIAIDRGEEE